MHLSLLLLASLTISYLPLSLSYRDGARSESCYNMLVMHNNFMENVVSPSECGNTCPYELRVVGRVNAENRSNPMETTYLFGETYHLMLTSASGSTFEGFIVEARERTAFEEDFVIESTIWGTWVTDQNQLGSGYDPNMGLLYHTVECNRSLTSSEGPFDNAATQYSPNDLTSLDLYWRAPPPPNSSEEYQQLPQQIQFWFVTVQQRLTYFYPIAGPILNCGSTDPDVTQSTLSTDVTQSTLSTDITPTTLSTDVTPTTLSTDVTPTTLSTDGTPTTLSTGPTVGILVGIIILLVGALAGVLLYHCICKHRSQFKPASSSYKQQQTDPVYEEVQADPEREIPITSGTEIELRENMAYEPVQRIELRENVAYGPAQH